MARKIEVIPARPEFTNRAERKQRKTRLAVYCRVSTSQEDQLESFENQQIHYRDYVASHPTYELVKIYADEGITGTNTRRREEFKAMIADCEAGLIDMVITKSISRFARNTADCLQYTRLLRDKGIGVLFEKEDIFTLDGKGELLITIMSSLAQDESRNISENITWGIRARFQQGKMHLNTNRFLGYDKDKDGALVINEAQAEIVRRIFDQFLDGLSPDIIASRLNHDGIPGVCGIPQWKNSTIKNILRNEKYKGDALLQKYITEDYLSGRIIRNDGRVEQYYVKGSHEAIIPAEKWEIVQLELKRRDNYRIKHGLRTLGRYTDEQPFSNKVFCGVCGALFWRRTWYRLAGEVKIWHCTDRYDKDDRPGCPSLIIKEKDLHRAFVEAWNRIRDTRDERLPVWQKQKDTGTPLVAFYAERFIQLSAGEPMKEIDLSIVTKTLEHVVVSKNGSYTFYLLDGSKETVDLQK